MKVSSREILVIRAEQEKKNENFFLLSLTCGASQNTLGSFSPLAAAPLLPASAAAPASMDRTETASPAPILSRCVGEPSHGTPPPTVAGGRRFFVFRALSPSPLSFSSVSLPSSASASSLPALLARSLRTSGTTTES